MPAEQFGQDANMVRDVTDDEVGFYQEHGWVKLEGLVSPSVVASMLERLKAHMGEDGCAAVLGPYSGYVENSPVSRPKSGRESFNTNEGLGRRDETFRAFTHSPEVASTVSRLLSAPARYWDDLALVKLPAANGGGKTIWHQDFPYYPVDRTGMLNVWIALIDIPAEMGTVRFIEGSHRWGPLGRVVHRTDGLDTVDLLTPDLAKKVVVSPPLNLKAGDATVHNVMTIHSAPENSTQEVRWAYVLTAFPDGTLYTGSPHRETDGLGLVVNQPIDHERFPLLSS